MIARMMIIAAVFLGGCAQQRTAIRPSDLDERATIEETGEARKLASEAQRKSQAGKVDEAIELYLKAVELDRDMGHAWNNLGVLYMQKTDYPSAIRALNTAAALLPADPRPVANIGQVWLDLGYARLALEQFEDALVREPSNLESLRGAIQASQLLDIADEQTSDWIKTAIFIERDPKWAEYLQVQRSRVDGRLETERRAGRR